MFNPRIKAKIGNFLRRGMFKSLAESFNRLKTRRERKLKLRRLPLESDRREKPTRVKIAAIMMAKNECDIIEHCIRINLRSFDRIFVLDHNSTDKTKDILRLLVNEGLPLVLVELDVEDAAYNQGELMTRMMRGVAQTDAFDFIMPLDADEFLVHHAGNGPGDDVVKLSPSDYGLVPWITYVPNIDLAAG